jgi:ElaB/YqjD/DUF883 family membrane-anchored ribosome-binding protein
VSGTLLPKHSGNRVALAAFDCHQTYNSPSSEDGNMNTTTTNGESSAADTAEVKEHLKAAGGAAANAARARAAQAQEWARTRASQAQDWAKGRLGDAQQSIEAQPYKAAALALGIGLLAGILLTTLASRRSS